MIVADRTFICGLISAYHLMLAGPAIEDRFKGIKNDLLPSRILDFHHLTFIIRGQGEINPIRIFLSPSQFILGFLKFVNPEAF